MRQSTTTALLDPHSGLAVFLMSIGRLWSNTITVEVELVYTCTIGSLGSRSDLSEGR